jgi:hypothetical protein
MTMDRYTASARANRLRNFPVFGSYRDETGWQHPLPHGTVCRGADEARRTITFDMPDGGTLTIPAARLVNIHEKFADNH